MKFFDRKPKPAPSPPLYYQGETFDECVTKLIDSFRPIFAAHPDVDVIRLNAIQDLFIRDGEAGIALEALIENLDDMNFKKVTAPISKEQANRTISLINGLSAGEQKAKYLAIVERITTHD